MPFQDVIFGRMGDYVWRWVGLNSGIFASELELDKHEALGGLGNEVRTRLLAARVAIVGSQFTAWERTSTCLEYQVTLMGRNRDISCRLNEECRSGK